MHDNAADHPVPPSPQQTSDRFIEAKRKLNVVLVWAALVGVLAGIVGAAFRVAVQHLLDQRTQIVQALSSVAVVNWLVPSLISGLLVFVSFWLMRQFAPDTNGSGIPQIEGTLDQLVPLDWRRVLPVKFGGGILALGASMVAGYEGPTIQMGGSLGKMVSAWAKASPEQTRTLIASGAGAGLAAAFNAPLAGILFIVEEARPKFESPVTSLRAVAIACITATIAVRTLLGQDAFLKITHFDRVPLASLWMFVVLGVGLGIVGYWFNAGLLRSLDWFNRLQGIPYRFVGLWVGSIIGFLFWLYPPIVGTGEAVIHWALNQDVAGYMLLLVFLARFGLTLFCYGSGAIGGVFAPMLAISTLFGMGLAKELSHWFPAQIPEPGVFAIAAMGALVAATVRAPLTAMLLTMELTDNYFSVLPLLITCTTAAMTAHRLGSQPIYSVLLKRLLEKRQQRPLTDSV